ncbi:MAG: hypothetical protein JSW64_01350 [Candidatus Zixiibacteriota bacterium]|nr:MAG: hypothetical protein JSW64_01350 [candidate division Zixibacteria bacterium]
MRNRLILYGLIIACMPLTLWAAVIHVPGDCPAIQAAVDSCAGGDTVMVAPGVYSGDGNRDISILAISITVISSDGPLWTIIDGGNGYKGFNIIGGGAPATVIEGFTIQNVSYGVYCDSASVVMNNVIIEDFLFRAIHFDGFLYDPPLTADIDECIIHQIDPSYQGTGIGFRGARSVIVSVYGSIFSDCLYGFEFHTLENRVPNFDIQKCVVRNNLLDGIWTHS